MILYLYIISLYDIYIIFIQLLKKKILTTQFNYSLQAFTFHEYAPVIVTHIIVNNHLKAILATHSASLLQ